MSKESNNTTFNQLETRIGCNVMVAFAIDIDGGWKVKTHVKNHNHKLAKEFEKHLLIGLITVVSFLSKESGCIVRFCFMQKDAYNLIFSKRKVLIEKGDV